MQTGAIPYRVAEFLKKHPPFHFMEEADLVVLASHGRVKFHEPDEYLGWQSSPHGPYFFVIQRGSVSLWDETSDPPVLKDIRGEGDCIGLERFNGSPTNLYSAKSESEVLVYALSAADLEPLLTRYPQAAKYVAAHSSVTADYVASGEAAGPHEMFVADLVRDRAPLHCAPSVSVQEAALLLNKRGAQALALVEENKVAGLVTSEDFVSWVAAGAVDPQQAVRNLARAEIVTVGPQSLVSDCVLVMADSPNNAVVLTSDGSPSGSLQSTITAAGLAPAFGDHPVSILGEIEIAPDFATLRAINTRARSWVLKNLTAPSGLDWLASWADFLNRRIFVRLLELTENIRPGQLYCFYGDAGRRELMTSVAPRIGVIGNVPKPIQEAMAQCGYIAPEPIVSSSLDDWKTRFSGWIRDPVRTQVYQSRPFFDLRPIYGSMDLYHELEWHVRAELAAEPIFLRVLANDCFSSLPPLTFFRDLVVEESGKQTDTFRLERSALQPLADVARVFSLAAGSPLGASTRERFEQARRLLPSKDSILREASDTMRLVLFHQARAGLRTGSSGAELPLSILSRHDRQVLKSGFRSIHNLLEFTSSGEWLEAL
jgi:CBS domain-containing protein